MRTYNEFMYKTLTPVLPLFLSAVRKVKNREYLLWFIISGVVFAVVMRLFALLSPFLFILMQVSEQQWIYMILIGLTFFLTIYGSVFSFALFLYISVQIVKGDHIELVRCLGAAHRSVVRTTWTIIGFGIIVLSSLVLFVIPGIIVGVWFFFAPTIAVLGTTKKHFFAQSRSLVKGRFFAVLWRLLLISVCSSGISYFLSFIHPFMSQLWAITTPFFSLIYTMLYLDLLPKINTK